MSELSPEERQRIYEEEKARLEAQNALKANTGDNAQHLPFPTASARTPDGLRRVIVMLGLIAALFAAVVVCCATLFYHAKNDNTISRSIPTNKAYRAQPYPGLAGVPAAESLSAFRRVMEAIYVDIKTGSNSATSHLLVTGELIQDINARDEIFVTEVEPSHGYARGWMKSGKLEGHPVYVPLECLDTTDQRPVR